MLLTRHTKDLTIRREGWFVLHYQVFDVNRISEGQSADAIATCYGSPFQVYPTKDFPGLEPSTELTQVRIVIQLDKAGPWR
jgi:hypothetical protein